jgi:hypothetical protein
MDDDLRPSMAKFGNVTKNVKDAQKLLKITLDGAAGSGKNQEKIANAVAKAYAGNTTSLKKMFPELMKSKDVLADFAKTYEGLAIANADPFMKFNNSMDILKEKLGVLVLPLIIDFIDYISKPGGVVDQVGKFFEAVGNPKTDVGKAFGKLKETVVVIGKDIAALFALMDTKGNDSMTGFANTLSGVSDILATITDSITVLAGSMAALGKGDFGRVIDLMAADIGVGAEAVRRNISVADTVNAINAETVKKGKGTIFVNSSEGTNNVIFGKPTGKLGSGITKTGIPFAQQQTNNITINVQGADPKATVDALGKYVKNNGSLPASLFPAKKP